MDKLSKIQKLLVVTLEFAEDYEDKLTLQSSYDWWINHNLDKDKIANNLCWYLERLIKFNHL